MNTPAPQTNTLIWLSQFAPHQPQLSSSDLQPVLEFTLVWNLFEKVVADHFITILKIRAHVDHSFNHGKILIEEFEPHLTFFRSRYPDHDDEDLLADKLLSEQRRGNHTELSYITLLSKVLSRTSTDANNVIFALLFIAYRVRNNLFHGEKDIFTLHLQADLFQTVNSLLMVYLGQTSRKIHG